MDDIYLPPERSPEWIRFEAERVSVRVSRKHPGVWLELPVARAGDDPITGFGPPPAGDGEPVLTGWRIALDPGHIGGEWGPMEQRSFRFGEGPIVQEGDLVLAVARRLREALEALGAEVSLLRETAEPVTSKRPADFHLDAFRSILAATGEVPDKGAVEHNARIRFYRTAEIEARAERVRALSPHVVIALHLDAAPWRDPEVLAPVKGNHGHVIINGAYLPGEVADDSQRLALLHRWLNGYAATEVPLGESLADAMAEMTGLAPVVYTGLHARQVAGHPYLWARNLMANRIFEAPVIFLEPWVLNNGEIYAWAAEGDFPGERLIGGRMRASLPAEYAAFVVEGFRHYGEQVRHESRGGDAP